MQTILCSCHSYFGERLYPVVLMSFSRTPDAVRKSWIFFIFSSTTFRASVDCFDSFVIEKDTVAIAGAAYASPSPETLIVVCSPGTSRPIYLYSAMVFAESAKR